KSLDALDRFQHQLAALPGVQAVVGPGGLAKRVSPLQELGNAVLSTEGNIGPVKQLAKLGRNLARAAGGGGAPRAGITQASDGPGLLALGADNAGEGARLIATGLARATAGSRRAISALDRFANGTERLTEALQSAYIAALQLDQGVRSTLVPNLRANPLR